MPQSTIIQNGHKSDAKCTKPTETFTGDVYLDPIHFDAEAAIANVTFTPCARTHWHAHEKNDQSRCR
ncbi:uncharacterized protein N7473_010081 [Penicillium subrubescens]|uniref:uncharacterized protein n=1 Tax=Penicillium subrubescens TaxID=1316194 RepID=UPI002545325B|nr:uncharacterized protein N7473_010081 [Penicillium subrubescens]KAJ5883195.1 hypothetical protein N7473_010081 [Penicillium subrubescens]